MKEQSSRDGLPLAKVTAQWQEMSHNWNVSEFVKVGGTEPLEAQGHPQLQVDVEAMNKQVMASYKTANGLTKSLEGDEVHPVAFDSTESFDFLATLEVAVRVKGMIEEWSEPQDNIWNSRLSCSRSNSPCSVAESCQVTLTSGMTGLAFVHLSESKLM